MKPSVTVWPSGPSTRPLIVTPGRSAGGDLDAAGRRP